MGFGLVIRSTERILRLTTISYIAFTTLHTLQITTTQTKSSQSATSSSTRCLVAASNGGRTLSSGFPNCPRPQLHISHFSLLTSVLSIDLTTPHVKVILLKIKVPLRLTVYRQSIRLGVKPFETHDERSLFYQQSPSGNSPYVSSSLTRKWVCLL
jgi:hypothetical protein